jgi:hypothetical protein
MTSSIFVGQGCIVKLGSQIIATSVKSISSCKFFFSVQPHPNFSDIENRQFTIDKVALGLTPINHIRHYAYTKSNGFDSDCWVEF